MTIGELKKYLFDLPESKDGEDIKLAISTLLRDGEITQPTYYNLNYLTRTDTGVVITVLQNHDELDRSQVYDTAQYGGKI